MQNAVSNPFFVSCTKDDKSHLRSSTSFPPNLFDQIIPWLENTREKKDKNKKKKKKAFYCKHTATATSATWLKSHLYYLFEFNVLVWVSKRRKTLVSSVREKSRIEKRKGNVHLDEHLEKFFTVGSFRESEVRKKKKKKRLRAVLLHGWCKKETPITWTAWGSKAMAAGRPVGPVTLSGRAAFACARARACALELKKGFTSVSEYASCYDTARSSPYIPV